MIGMTAAIVSMNAVESHWALRAVMSRSAISRGIALIMIVSLRITMNVASTSHRITAGVRAGASRADTVVPSRSERLMQGQTRSAEGIHR